MICVFRATKAWNASKTKVLYTLEKNKVPAEIPKKASVKLNNVLLDRVVITKWLGYMLNHVLSDADHIQRQSCRLYALTHTLSKDLPLWLLDDSWLRKLIAAYSTVYLLPILTSCTKKEFQKLKSAHRYFVEKVSQFRKRDKDFDPEAGNWNNSNSNIYGRLDLRKLEETRAYSAYSFALRFKTYVKSFSPGQSLYYWHRAQKTRLFQEYLRLEKLRIRSELRAQLANTRSPLTTDYDKLQCASDNMSKKNLILKTLGYISFMQEMEELVLPASIIAGKSKYSMFKECLKKHCLNILKFD